MSANKEGKGQVTISLSLKILSSSITLQFTAHKTIKVGGNDNSFIKINTENASGNKRGQFSLHKPLYPTEHEHKQNYFLMVNILIGLA